MPFHRDSAKQIENLIKNFQHNEYDKIIDKNLYNKYFQTFLKMKEPNIKTVLNYLYTVDGIIPFFLKGLLGEAPIYQFESYSNFKEKFLKEINEKFAYSFFSTNFNVNKEEFELNKNDFMILYINIRYFEANLNVILDKVFERLAKNASILPDFIIGKIASIALTPYMCANIARFLPKNQALSLMKQFDNQYLTEVVFYMIPNDVAKIMPEISLQQVEEIFKNMIQKGYYKKIIEIYENFNGDYQKYLNIISSIVKKYPAEKLQQFISLVSPFFENQNKKHEFLKILQQI